MLGSLFEGAKATIRRAGAVDAPLPSAREISSTRGIDVHDNDEKFGLVPPSPTGSCSSSSSSRTRAAEAHDALLAGTSSEPAGTIPSASAGTSAPSSVSRSFSLLRASGSASVTRAMQPLKNVFGGNPEATEARARLKAYNGQISTVLAETVSSAAKRRDERDLLTRALAGQENDLRCWGYLSVLPAFREHRRQETSRAQQQVSLAEQQEKALSGKCQEVNRVLRSIPIIGPWTKPSGRVLEKDRRNVPGNTPDVARTSPRNGPGVDGAREDRKDARIRREQEGVRKETGWGMSATTGGDWAYTVLQREDFFTPPANILAFDTDLALARRELRACDRECAAAADSFAMAVVDVGGLEPRSSEDRAQMLLSLLSRYHVLGEAEAEAQAAGAGGSATADASPTADESRSQASPKATDVDALSTVAPASEPVLAATDVSDKPDYKDVGDAAQSDGNSDSGIAKSLADNDVPVQPPTNEDGNDCCSTSALSSSSSSASNTVVCSSRSSSDHSAGKSELEHDAGTPSARWIPPTSPSRLSSSPPLTLPAADDAIKMRAHATQDGGRTEGGVLAGAVGGREGGVHGMGVHFPAEGRKKCEERFLEMMSDERTREGRLLRRFLTMARGRKSPPSSYSSVPPAKKNASRSSTFSAAAAAAAATAATATAAAVAGISSQRSKGVEDGKDKVSGRTPEGGVIVKRRAGDEWDGDGAVGPQVVKAFINYFAREYLGGRFDVPEMLLPSLTDLVASVVFRQARRLVLGYESSSVLKNDLAWRKKAEEMRALSMEELGVEPEYIPGPEYIPAGRDSRGNTSGSGWSAADPEHAALIVHGKQGEEETTLRFGEAATLGEELFTTEVKDERGCSDRTSRAGNADDPSVRGVPSARDDAVDKNAPENSEESEHGPGLGDGRGLEDDAKPMLAARAEDGDDPASGCRVLSPQNEDETATAGEVAAEAAEDVNPVDATPKDAVRTTDAITTLVQERARPDEGVGSAEASECSTTAGGVHANISVEKEVAGSDDDDRMIVGEGNGDEERHMDGKPVLTMMLVEQSEIVPANGSAAATPATEGSCDDTAREGHDRVVGGGAGTDERGGAKRVAIVAAVAVDGTVAATIGGAASATAAAARLTPPTLGPAADDAASGTSANEFEDVAGATASADADGSAATAVAVAAVATAAATPVSRGQAYARASEKFGRLGDCIMPKDMAFVVKEGITCLTREAASISGSENSLDADALLPLLVYALVNARLPRVHEALNFLRNFRGASWGGEQAYYVTCIEAAVSFVLDWDPIDNDKGGPGDHSPGITAGSARAPPTTLGQPHANGGVFSRVSTEGAADDTPADIALCSGNPAHSASAGGVCNRGRGNDDAEMDEAERLKYEEERERKDGREALMRLGIFLEKHEVQEDTVDVLSSGGWM